MPKPLKKFLLVLLSAVALWIAPQTLYASRASYYDFGPYYSERKVLGFAFSSLENLPVPQIPENLIPQAGGLTSASAFYPLERLVENVQLTFTFDPIRRDELRLEFVSERLAEAKTLIDQGRTEGASRTLDDYAKTLEVLAQNLANQSGQNNAGFQALADKVEEVVSQQAVVAQTLSLQLPPAEAESWALAAEASLEVLDEVAEVKGELPIPEDLSTAVQELKDQGLISEEESNKLYGLDSRSEVRSELDKLVSSGQFPGSELIKLDTAVAENFPEFSEDLQANLQVAELRAYQTLPQPSDKILDEMKKWQDNPVGAPPSNDIKPYLWYNRASGLAQDVDLSNFSTDQQADVAKFYPKAVTENPTYVAPPSPSPSPSPLPESESESSPAPSASPAPSPAPPTAGPYLSENIGSLPGQPTYFIKQWGENLRFVLTFDPAEKARQKMQQAERRLSEAAALSSDPKKASFYEGAIKDYQQTMADASRYLKDSKDEGKAQAVAEKLEAQAARHEALLEKGLLPMPADPKLISEAIKATEDALDRSADVQDRPALPIALASRLGDLKAQGLILDEEVEDLVESNSREEVRGKIRKFLEMGAFPLADAKKLDEAQVWTTSSDYNQLIEVRKVEELQKLRAVQSEFAQTPTLKASAVNLSQRELALVNSIDPAAIKLEDLGGREDLVQTYQQLVATASARPLNSGQFGPDVTLEATPAPSPQTPRSQDAVLTTCPVGATFKQFEGCVWADSGRKINDYEQYKCDGSGQYFSFAAKKCVPYDGSVGFRDDVQPICPVGFNWSWQSQNCQTSSGGSPPWPSPSPVPEPIDEDEIAERSRSCPEGSSYQSPQGCVWDSSDKPVYDSDQYRCGGRGQYYSFDAHKCVASPPAGQPYPEDAAPSCQEEGAYWSWSDGKCIIPEEVSSAAVKDVAIPKPNFATPGSLFYPLKQFGEIVQLAVAFSPEAKQGVRVAQARERLAEGYAALEKDDSAAFSKALAGYTSKMQEMFNDLSKSTLSEQAKKAIAEKLAQEAVEQNLILQKIEVVATSEQAPSLNTASSLIILGADKAADLSGEPPLPDEVKAKVEALPEEMISESDKKALLEADSRVEARLHLTELAAKGGLTTADTAFLNEDFEAVDPGAKFKIGELKKLEEIATIGDQKEQTLQKIEKNEDIVEKLTEFGKSFEPGKEIPAQIRPYVRLTRIEEVAQTIRPDIVRLEDFQNRKDVILAVATLQEEFRPTQQAIQKVEEFRRRNPGVSLPAEFARIEALAFSLGVRNQAGPCFLPSPPFPANTPCPPPGAPIPVASYSSFGPAYPGSPSQTWSGGGWYGGGGGAPSFDKDGKPLVYGQGPAPASGGICPDGYHWMYDSGGWCMSNSGSYSASSYPGSYTPSGPATPGYTPYSPYYNAPGAYPATSGYQGGYSYSPPSYYGSAPTYYTTNPYPGSVPGSGPKPTAPGQCPSGYHWMSDSGGWCMADGPTYVPGGPPPGGYPTGTATSSTPPPEGYNCGSQPYDPVTKRCRDGACPGGFNWNGSQCVSGGTYYSPNLTQSSCGPGYYWDGRGCIPTYSGSYSGSGGGYSTSSSYQYGCTPGNYWNGSTCVAGSYEGSGWSDTAARSQSWCQPPSGGCGSNSYWDYGSCYCRSSSTYYGGSGPTPGNYCQGLSCGGGAWLDYSTCSCKYSGGSGTSSTGSTITCYPPSAGCPGGWYDYGTCSCKYSSSGTSSGGGSSYCSPPSGGCGSGWWDSGSCSCKTASSQGCYNVSASSCGSGWYWDSAACTCRQSTSSGSTTSGSGTSSGSCPSGYHWMSDNGGWCMQDGAGSTTPSSSPAPASTPAPESTPAPQSTPPPSESTPPPAPESTPAPSP